MQCGDCFWMSLRRVHEWAKNPWTLSCHYTPFREFIPIIRISEPLQTGLTPGAAGGKKSAQDGVALLLANLAPRGHQHHEIRPTTSLRKDESAAYRATTAPPWPAKGVPKGEVQGAWEMFKSPQ